MSNQGAQLASIQAVTSTNLGYNGDWLALFDAHSIAGSNFNGRMLAWINARLNSGFGNINSAKQALAKANGSANFSSLGGFTVVGDNTSQVVALFGDSIAAQDYSESGVTAFNYENNGLLTPLNYITFDRYTTAPSLNKGVSGNTTTQMAARLSDLDGLGADLVFVMGGTNDVNGSASASTITNNLSTIYSYITNDLSAKAVAFTILPRSGLTDIKTAVLLEVNDWIRSQNSDDILVVDSWYVFGDRDGLPISGYTYDTSPAVHPSSIGAMVIARKTAERLGGLYGRGSSITDFTGDLLTNGALSGSSGSTGTGTTGDVANSWSASASGTTSDSSWRAFSKTPEGWQKIVINIPSGNNSSEITYFSQKPSFSTGTEVYGLIELDVQSISGDVVDISLDVREEGTSDGNIYHRGMDDKGINVPVYGPGIARTPNFTIREDASDVNFRLLIEADTSTNSAEIVLLVKAAKLQSVS